MKQQTVKRILLLRKAFRGESAKHTDLGKTFLEKLQPFKRGKKKDVVSIHDIARMRPVKLLPTWADRSKVGLYDNPDTGVQHVLQGGRDFPLDEREDADTGGNYGVAGWAHNGKSTGTQYLNNIRRIVAQGYDPLGVILTQKPEATLASRHAHDIYDQEIGAHEEMGRIDGKTLRTVINATRDRLMNLKVEDGAPVGPAREALQQDFGSDIHKFMDVLSNTSMACRRNAIMFMGGKKLSDLGMPKYQTILKHMNEPSLDKVSNGSAVGFIHYAHDIPDQNLTAADLGVRPHNSFEYPVPGIGLGTTHPIPLDALYHDLFKEEGRTTPAQHRIRVYYGAAEGAKTPSGGVIRPGEGGVPLIDAPLHVISRYLKGDDDENAGPGNYPLSADPRDVGAGTRKAFDGSEPSSRQREPGNQRGCGSYAKAFESALNYRASCKHTGCGRYLAIVKAVGNYSGDDIPPETLRPYTVHGLVTGIKYHSMDFIPGYNQAAILATLLHHDRRATIISPGIPSEADNLSHTVHELTRNRGDEARSWEYPDYESAKQGAINAYHQLGIRTLIRPNTEQEPWYKSITKSVDAPDPGSDGESAPEFYSNLERLLKHRLQNNTPADQVRGLVRSAGIPAEEQEYGGIEDHLQAHPGKVNKAELLSHVHNALPKVNVVQHGFNSGLENRNKNIFAYRERLNQEYGHWKQWPKEELDQVNAMYGPAPTAGPAKYEQYTLPGGENYREHLLALPGGTSHTFDDGHTLHSADSYTSSHWDEPNIVAHVRMNERPASDGKRALHVEEVQSDWQQKGREVGYGPSDYGNGVPDAPFKKNWHELAMKHALHEAAAGGHDKLTWTTGEQQNKRYPGLGTVADELHYDRGANILNAWKDRKHVRQWNVPEHELHQYIGRDVADRLMDPTNHESYDYPEDDPHHPGNQVLHNENGNFDVGGQGMKGFYGSIDQNGVQKHGMIGNWMNNYAKKWGQQVGVSHVATPDYSLAFDPEDLEISHHPSGDLDSNDWQLYDRGTGVASWHPNQQAAEEAKNTKAPMSTKTQAVHSIDITPEMRHSILNEGQPLWGNRDVLKKALLIFVPGHLVKAYQLKFAPGEMGQRHLLQSRHYSNEGGSDRGATQTLAGRWQGEQRNPYSRGGLPQPRAMWKPDPTFNADAHAASYAVQQPAQPVTPTPTAPFQPVQRPRPVVDPVMGQVHPSSQLESAGYQRHTVFNNWSKQDMADFWKDKLRPANGVAGYDELTPEHPGGAWHIYMPPTKPVAPVMPVTPPIDPLPTVADEPDLSGNKRQRKKASKKLQINKSVPLQPDWNDVV